AGLENPWIVSGMRDQARLMAPLEEPDNVRDDDDDRQNDDDDGQCSRGECACDDRHDSRAAIPVDRRQNLKTGVENRLRQIEFLWTVGCDRDRGNAQRRLLGFHAVQYVLEGGLDQELGLETYLAADFPPQLDAESGQLAAFLEHEGLDQAGGDGNGFAGSLS